MADYDLSKRSIEVMIKCGCFDSVYPNRHVLMYNYERLIDIHLERARLSSSGQLDWFSAIDEDDTFKFINESGSDFSLDEKLSFEYEYAGMYFSGHPLDKWRLKVAALSEYSVSQISDDPGLDGKRICVCGRITGISSRRTKSGKLMVNFKLSDFTGEIPCVAYENTALKYKSYMFDGAIITAIANVNCLEDDSGSEIIIQNLIPLEAARIGGDKSLYIKVKNKSHFESIRNEFLKYGGESKLIVYFEDSKTMVCSDSLRNISIADALLDFLSQTLGEDNIKIK